MKALTIIASIILLLTLSVGSVNAADKMETVTFAWTDTNAAGVVKNFELYWGVTLGGPYAKLAVIPYAVQAPVEATVTGEPETTERRYFVLTACGDVTQQDGTTTYECSQDADGNMLFSNEVYYDFWIEHGGFSVPVQFIIVTQ